MSEKLLLTPGPVPLPTHVSAAMAQPVIPHRSGDFSAFYTALLGDLRYLFQTKHPVVTLSGSGTAGVEMAMYSLFRPGDKVLVTTNGKFSNRWAAFGRVLGLAVAEVQLEWGKVPTVEEMKKHFAHHPELSGVVLTHCETSTGAALDLEEISHALRQSRPDALLLVDAVTTVAAQALYTDAWELDCVVTASQKALMSPAGVAAVSFSPRAQARLQKTHPGDYRNLLNYVRQAEKAQYPYTPPVSLLYGLAAATQSLRSRGLPAVWRATHESARTFRTKLESLGGRLHGDAPADALTVFSFPNRDADELRAELARSGFILAGGQGAWTGKVLRVSHMGLADARAMESLGACLEKLVR